jgi:hypothetical protein
MASGWMGKACGVWPVGWAWAHTMEWVRLVRCGQWVGLGGYAPWIGQAVLLIGCLTKCQANQKFYLAYFFGRHSLILAC